MFENRSKSLICKHLRATFIFEMKVYLNFRAKNNVKIYIFGVKIQTETFLLILKHCASQMILQNVEQLKI